MCRVQLFPRPDSCSGDVMSRTPQTSTPLGALQCQSSVLRLGVGYRAVSRLAESFVSCAIAPTSTAQLTLVYNLPPKKLLSCDYVPLSLLAPVSYGVSQPAPCTMSDASLLVLSLALAMPPCSEQTPLTAPFGSVYLRRLECSGYAHETVFPFWTLLWVSGLFLGSVCFLSKQVRRRVHVSEGSLSARLASTLPGPGQSVHGHLDK